MTPLKVLALATSLGLCACATSRIPIDQAASTPAARVHLAQVSLEAAPDRGQIVITRDAGFRGAACTTHILVDGILAAELRPAEKVSLYLAAGTHVVGAEPDLWLCRGSLKELTVAVRPGEQLAFRYGYGPIFRGPLFEAVADARN